MPFTMRCHFFAIFALLAIAASPIAQAAAPTVASPITPTTKQITPPTTQPAPPVYRIGRASSPIVVDGKLDDAAWQSADWTDDFLDIKGREQPAPPSDPPARTRAKMLWDDQHLYIAAELFDTDIRGEMREHDAHLYRENAFEIFIDPDNDGRNYAEIEFNALNTVFDLLMDKPYRAGGKSDNAWTLAGLHSAIGIDGTLNDGADTDRSWTIEIAIPWESLRNLAPDIMPPKTSDRWRLNMARMIYARGETKAHIAVWSPIGRVDMHVPDRWGWIEFARGAKSPAMPQAKK